mmetsp:Transcript_35284/g.90241  ORF Transcript_35284/g.90241 Transcript_35284/m.90241 type:complete len:250 (+) Transcript_35284:210-959(+)|eukprot:jgi/Tetstr1/444220/TSEL_032113.t1
MRGAVLGFVAGSAVAVAARAVLRAVRGGLGGTYTLKYFGLPALGEPARMVLELSGVKWVDELVTFADWPAMKPTTKWGQLPVLITPSGKEMTQAKSILRYLGRKVYVNGKPLYPACPEKAFDVDEMIDALEDARATMLPTFAIEDQAEKEAARAALLAPDGKMTAVLLKLEERCGSPYILGDQLTVADLWCYMFVNVLRCGFLEGFPKDYLTAYPGLSAVAANCASMPRIAAYIEKKAAGNPMYACYKA